MEEDYFMNSIQFEGYSNTWDVYVVENGCSRSNYTHCSLNKNEEGYYKLWDIVKTELRIKEEFNMHDMNGSKIYSEDFHHLIDGSVIYICPKKRDFDYRSLLGMYKKEK